MEIIRKQEQTVTQWSGGETRQLYIFPHESSLQKRDFFFRISTATIAAETSTFTPMPNYFRLLMVLDGELKLVHKNQHTARLKKFETDNFLGEWETNCFGTGTDFNLISTAQYACIANANTAWDTKPFAVDYRNFMTNVFMYGFYIINGEMTISQNGHSTTLESGDVVCFDRNDLYKTSIVIDVKPKTVAIDFTVEQLYN